MSLISDDKYVLMVDCLKNTICFTDQIKRRQAEAILKELSDDTINHILMVLNCLKNDFEISSKFLIYKYFR